MSVDGFAKFESLPPSLLSQLANTRRAGRQDRADSEDRERKLFREGLEIGSALLANNPDVKFKQALPGWVPVDAINTLEEMQRGSKKQQRQAEATPPLANLLSSLQRDPAAEVSPLPKGQVGPPERAPIDPRVEQFQSLLQSAGGANSPELLNALASKASGLNQVVAGTDAESVANKRLFEEKLGTETATLRRTSRITEGVGKRDDLIDSGAEQLALASLGLRDPVSLEDLTRQYRELPTVHTDSDALKMATEANFLAQAKSRDLLMNQQSMTGKQADAQRAEDVFSMMEEKWGKGAVKMRDVRLSIGANPKLIEDPLSEQLYGTLRWLAVPSQTAANKIYETRVQQGLLLNQLDAAHDAFLGMRAAHEAGETRFVGPGFTKDVNDFLAKVGMQDPTSAVYINSSFEFVSTLLKARQGSRPSDYDSRMYLSLLPLPSEVMSPAADAKMAAMRQSVMMGLRAYGNSAHEREVQQIKGQPKTAEDRALDRVIEKFEASMENGERDPAALAEFYRGVEKWQRVRGSKFIPPGATGAPSTAQPLSPKGQSAVEAALQ